MDIRMDTRSSGQWRDSSLPLLFALGLTIAGGSGIPFATSQAISSSAVPFQITSDTPLTHDAAVGTVGGEGSTEGGAASYRIPISAPPGRAGLEPNVALVYNSRGGNGVAGMGWSLSASSAIQRCPQTMEQDGRTRGVSYDADDRLCLDGQRLVRFGGSAYGQSGAEYRTEIDSYARITQIGGDLTSSAACFKVEQKSGRIQHYGAVSAAGICLGSARSARVQPAGAAATLSWLIEKEEDRVGNNMFYTYIDYGNGEVLPRLIEYTGFGTDVGDRSVRMQYGARQASNLAALYHADIASSYLDGGLTMQTQRLVRVDTYESINSKVGSWTLDYQNTTSRYSGRSLLRAINHCQTVGSDVTCFSTPTTFEWRDRLPYYLLKSLTFPGLPQSAWTATDAQIAQAALQDLQADQLAELGIVGRTELPLGELPITPASETALGSVLGFSTIADFDGDGARESFARVHTGSGQRGFLIQTLPDRTVRNAVDMTGQTVSPNEFNNEVADVDGDGRTEILAYTSPLSLGVWNAAPGAPAGSPVFRSVPTNVPPGGLFASQFRARLSDFDGDAKPDIVTFSAVSNCDGFGTGVKNGVFIHRSILPGGSLGTSANFALSSIRLFCLERDTTSSIPGLGEFVERIADFDGDGLPDFFIAKSVGANNSTTTFTRIVLTRWNGSAFSFVEATLDLSNDERSRTASRAAHWIDINGDGLDDYVFGQSQASDDTPRTPTGVWLVRLNRGGTLSARIDTGNGAGLQTTNSGNTTLRYANRLPPMDIDSDGRIDLLTPREFAVRMCAYTSRVPNLAGECGETSPNNLGQCVEYLCPELPSSLPDDFDMGTIYNARQVKPLYRQNAADLDQSSYKLNALRFVQTGPTSIVVQEVPTSIVASLDRQAPEDTYGDSVPDLITTVGCKYGAVGGGVIGFHPCMIVNSDGLGPDTLAEPGDLLIQNSGNGEFGYYFENHNRTYISEGRGSFDPTHPDDAHLINGRDPRPGDVIQDVLNGLGDSLSWRYGSLTLVMPNGWASQFLPQLYSVPSTNRYVDDRHFYFTSTMQVVQAMTRSTAAQRKPGVPLNGSRSFFYGYTEAMYNRLGRGFQGFRSITELDLGDMSRAMRTTTTFHQKFPLTSKVESVVATPRNRPSLPVAQEAYDWRCGLTGRVTCSPPVVGQPTIVAPYLDNQVSTTYDLATTQGDPGLSEPVGTTTTINAASDTAPNSGWDAWGNLRAQVVTVADALTGGGGGKFLDSRTTSTTNNYTADTSNWWVNKLDSTSTSSTIAYATGHPLPAPCTVGSCTPTRSVGTNYVWNPDRTLQSQTLQPGVAQQQVVTTYGYPIPTSYGLPISVTITASGATPASRASTLTYSNDGVNAAADGYLPLATTNDLLQTTTTQRRRRDGQVSRLIDATNLQTVTQFDPFGRAKQVDYKQTNGVTALAPSKYISVARCREISGPPENPIPAWCPTGYGEGTGQDLAVLRTTVVQAGQPTQVTWQDKLGRTVKQATRGLNGSFVQSLTEYDVSGSVERQSTPHYGGNTTYWTTFTDYDQMGRPGRKVAPASEMDVANGDVVTQYTYTGTKTAIKVRGEYSALDTGDCPAGVLCMDMASYHDSLGRLVKTVQNDGPTAEYAVTRYWFDGPGNPVAAKDAEGNVLRATYNNAGHRLTMIDPDAGNWSFGYDGFGQLLSQTDARGVTTTTTYDALGRMATRSSTNPGGAGLGSEAVLDSWNYDVAAPGLLDFARRQMGSGLPQVWKEQYGYNAATRRMETMSTTIAGEASPWVTYQSYDTFGREQVTTYPSGLAVQRNYTSSGHFAQLANAITFQGYWTASAQDAFGNITAENYGNGVYASHTTYASTGQYQYKRWYAASNALLDQFQYTYDSFGNLKQQARTPAIAIPGTVEENYQYDGLQRLTQSSRVGVVGAVPINTSYSPGGNLLSKSDNGLEAPGAYVYGANGCGPHAVGLVIRPAPEATRTYGCDANGNVVSGNEISAVYDFMNLPRIVNRIGEPHSGSTTFRYDANGQRFQEVTGSGETTLFGPKGYEKVTGTTVGVNVRHRHELGPVIVNRTNGVDDVTYATRDRIGSLAAALPNNPFKADMRSYDPFGNPRYGDFTDIGKQTATGFLDWRPMTARGFTGHEHIDEGRVIHMNGRVFDYALGRFLGPDPIIQFPSNSQSLNPYSYIMNNPFAGTDPSGYSIENPDLPEPGETKEATVGQTGSHIKTRYTVVGRSDGGIDGYRGGRSNGSDSSSSKGPQSSPKENSGADKIGSSANTPPKGLNYANQSGCGGRGGACHNFSSSQGGISAPGDSAGLARGAETLAGFTGVGGTAISLYELTTGRSPLSGDEASRGWAAAGIIPFVGLIRKGANATEEGFRAYRSFRAFKRAEGVAGEGYEWHHKVEQTLGNRLRFGVADINSTMNLVKVDVQTHRKISGFYSSIQDFSQGQTVRKWLAPQSFEQQYEFGTDVLKRYEALKP